MTIPWWELVVRGVVVYGFLLIMLRISGKRQVGQMAPFVDERQQPESGQKYQYPLGSLEQGDNMQTFGVTWSC